MFERRFRVRSLWTLLLLPLLAVTGCESMGPGTVTRDRFDYAGSVGESWKTQMLLNLVKIRYGDIPVFMARAKLASIRASIGSVLASWPLARAKSRARAGLIRAKRMPAWLSASRSSRS